MLSESDIKEKVNATEYWYFRFNEHFFDDIKIAQMETLPGGFEMLVILLKLYCLSVKERGMFRLPNANGEPDYEALAKLTRHPRRTLEMAIQYFVSMGFVEIIIGHDVGETIFKTPKLENMIGKSSKEADRKRLARSRQQQNELPENTDERKTKCDKYGVFNNVYLQKDEYKALDEKYKKPTLIVTSQTNGVVKGFNTKEIGKIVANMGTVKIENDDVINYENGVITLQKINDKVKINDPLFYIYANDMNMAESVKIQLLKCIEIK